MDSLPATESGIAEIRNRNHTELVRHAKATTPSNNLVEVDGHRNAEFVDSVFGKLPNVTVGTIGIVAAICGTIIVALLIVLVCMCCRRNKKRLRDSVAKATDNYDGAAQRSSGRPSRRGRRRQSALSSLVTTGLPGSSSGSPWGDFDEEGETIDGKVVDTTFATTVESPEGGSAGAFSPRLAELGSLLPSGSGGAAGRKLSSSSTLGPPRTATVGNNGKAVAAAAAAAATTSSSSMIGLRQKTNNTQDQQQPPRDSTSTRSKVMYEIVV